MTRPDLSGEQGPTDAMVELAAWVQHERDGHGTHPEDDAHYCWPSCRKEYRTDALYVLSAVFAALPEVPRA